MAGRLSTERAVQQTSSTVRPPPPPTMLPSFATVPEKPFPFPWWCSLAWPDPSLSPRLRRPAARDVQSPSKRRPSPGRSSHPHPTPTSSPASSSSTDTMRLYVAAQAREREGQRCGLGGVWCRTVVNQHVLTGRRAQEAVRLVLSSQLQISG